ncbi:MAG: glycosyltransferase [Methanomicrobiales archaeon]|nr:glycosyltransferase [Methanomicrobiales archaeon]
MAHVLVSPLNWGLGHATRDMPLIRKLREKGHDVTIAACGNARAALEQEFPDCTSLDFPDYPTPYSNSRFFLPKFVLFLPLMLKAFAEERRRIQKIADEHQFDLIISDNRLGVFSDKVPSIFITHQLHYHLPFAAWPFELAAVQLNGYLYSKYDRVIVPDNPPGPNALAGKLSRADTEAIRSRAYYAGILTSTQKQDVTEDLDYLVLISGPEPQRTQLEKILLPKVQELEGSSVVLLGSPNGASRTTTSGRCRTISYATTEEKQELMNRAKCIICRSGYTSMMELAELKKQHALFIPTPGQTEQEYLSWYYRKQGWFPSTSQYRPDLLATLETAGSYTGFPAMPDTGTNVARLYDELLAGYLEC